MPCSYSLTTASGSLRFRSRRYLACSDALEGTVPPVPPVNVLRAAGRVALGTDQRAGASGAAAGCAGARSARAVAAARLTACRSMLLCRGAGQGEAWVTRHSPGQLATEEKKPHRSRKLGQYGPARMSTAANLADVAARVVAASTRSTARASTNPARLVAVSKTKPVEQLRECYDAGQRCFGENYVQEIVEKAPQMPPDTVWHFIGHLQSNKVKALVTGVPSLAVVETVDTVKLANKLNTAVGDFLDERARVGAGKLGVMVQVNTSGEESKFGVEPKDCLPLARHIRDECSNLAFRGLMTIGMPDYTSRPENFQTLAACRDEVCAGLGLETKDVELSMGMSGDFESAIEMGSDNVRVGSTIFGARANMYSEHLKK